jgi:hypothetical protein
VDSSAHRIPILNPNPLLKERNLLLSAPVVFLVRMFRVYSRRFLPYGLQSAKVSEFGSSEIFLEGSDFEI